jgi:hypothetical protein
MCIKSSLHPAEVFSFKGYKSPPQPTDFGTRDFFLFLHLFGIRLWAPPPIPPPSLKSFSGPMAGPLGEFRVERSGALVKRI